VQKIEEFGILNLSETVRLLTGVTSDAVLCE
jgi:hypothetical protein